MRTPEEIKKGLECSVNKRCFGTACPYWAAGLEDSDYSCMADSRADALAYIQQLESLLAQVELERDTAVACIQKMHEALEVKDDTIGSYRLNVSMALKAFTEWIMKCRDVCEENTKEDAR